jgi:hypothetical protein
MIALILGIVLILAAAAVVTVIMLRDKGETDDSGGNIPVIDENNYADIMADVQEKVDKSMFQTHMNAIWTFPDGKSASKDAVMGNSTGNNYPMWFDVTVDGEVVYTSSLLPVGTQVKELVLDKDLDPGKYEASVAVHLVDDTNNNEPLDTNVTLSVEIIVQN